MNGLAKQAAALQQQQQQQLIEHGGRQEIDKELEAIQKQIASTLYEDEDDEDAEEVVVKVPNVANDDSKAKNELTPQTSLDELEVSLLSYAASQSPSTLSGSCSSSTGASSGSSNSASPVSESSAKDPLSILLISPSQSPSSASSSISSSSSSSSSSNVSTENGPRENVFFKQDAKPNKWNEDSSLLAINSNIDSSSRLSPSMLQFLRQHCPTTTTIKRPEQSPASTPTTSAIGSHLAKAHSTNLTNYFNMNSASNNNNSMMLLNSVNTQNNSNKKFVNHGW
jgi:hypothetical protein